MTGQIEGLVFPKVYEKYAGMLAADNPVTLTGKLSFREEEEPKLLVDTVSPLLRAPEATAHASAPRLTDAQLAKLAEQKLYVKLASRDELESVKQRCAAHAGEVPVYVRLTDEKITLLLTRDYWCDGGPEALGALQSMLPPGDVVLKDAKA